MVYCHFLNPTFVNLFDLHFFSLQPQRLLNINKEYRIFQGNVTLWVSGCANPLNPCKRPELSKLKKKDRVSRLVTDPPNANTQYYQMSAPPPSPQKKLKSYIRYEIVLLCLCVMLSVPFFICKIYIF